MAICLTTSACLADAVTATPWLAGVTKDSVYVSLEANSTATARVDFGLTSAYGMTAETQNVQATDAPTYVHNIKLTGLLPNTQYHYRVTQGASVSQDYSFWTAPLAGTTVRWGFAADSRSGTTVHNIIASGIASYQPRMMVYGGDLCANTSYSSWKTEWFVPNQVALNATTPWINSPGNHEAWNNNQTKAFTQSPTGDPDYYSFDYGDAHILVLNYMVTHSKGSAQWNFAAADLAASNKTWNIVLTHSPAYADRAGYDEVGDADFRAMATDVFEPNGVDLYLAGHQHFYQHNRVNGIEYLISGSMGAPLYSPDPNKDDYVVYTESIESFAIFDMTPTTFTINTYRGDNSLIESFVLVAPEPATLTLLGLGALAMLRKRRN
ncbi:MAG: metallophosphoesterase family protein [Planctomycetaceae bacterium]|nr:metallophosphoesterase family protein [Planctomycetaceae bacterium]